MCPQMPLTDRAVKSLKPSPKSRKVSDEKGLYVLVHSNGSKYWRLKYRIAGREKTLALGVYPDTSLAMAREARDGARRELAKGLDPGETKRTARRTQTETFARLAEEWMQGREPTLDPVHMKKVRQRVERDLIPAMGSTPIRDLTVPMIHRTLKRIVDRGSLETARRALQNTSQIMRFAVGKGVLSFDPTTALRDALPAPVVTNFAAIVEPKPLGDYLKAVEGCQGAPQVCAALRLTNLVVVRPGELRSMEWGEIDFDDPSGPLWSIPSEKMKQRLPHLVPLSTQAVAILRGLEPVTRRSRWVFPGVRDHNRRLSDGTLAKAIRGIGYDTSTVTPHGSRATFRTLADEILGEPVHLIEHQLAHTVRDPLGRSYNRTSHLPERRKMMQRWADYLDSLRDSEGRQKVVPLRRSAS